jgi:hypothetical protein
MESLRAELERSLETLTERAETLATDRGSGPGRE